MNKLVNLDEKLTHKLAICGNKQTKNKFLYYLRYILIGLELSFHGLPWFLFVIVSLMFNTVSYSIVKPLFLGLYLNENTFYIFNSIMTNHTCLHRFTA